MSFVKSVSWVGCACKGFQRANDWHFVFKIYFFIVSFLT